MSTLCREYRAVDPPALVAWPTNTVSLEDKFHNAVLSSKLQKIKDLAARGVNVDCLNEDGQTPLFCAAYKGLTDVVSLLISLGANPNARCQPEGYTAVHGACYSGSVSILKMLIQAGGDLRICDHKRRTPKAWSLLQPDSQKVHSIHNVIESARLCTTETSGMEMLKEMQSSLSPRSGNVLSEVVRSIFRKSVVNRDSRSRNGIQINMDELRNGIHHTGFGKVYFGAGERCASVVGLPYISEVSDLEEVTDDDVPSWICGKFTSFNPKVWTSRKTEVSTRELYSKAGPHCVPDILINELEVRGKLHHPNLLMLLGVCQTDHCEAVSLVYERVSIGSLYSVLHIDQRQLTPKFATDVIIQICDALEYVHSMKMIHCGVSSHAIMLVSNGVAKLSCFEYCLPENIHSELAMTLRHPILTSDAHLSVLRHWMAPEVLLRQQFSVRSDVYSLCCVMWELCHLDLPWRTFTLQSLRQQFSSTNAPLPMNKGNIPKYWYHLLSLGLTTRRSERDLEISEIKDMMMLSRKPQAIHVSRGSLMGSLRRSAKPAPPTVTKEAEPESEDGLDVVDVGDYMAPNGQVYRATSVSSLPDLQPPPGHEFKGTNTSFLREKSSASGDFFKADERIKRFEEDEELEIMHVATKREPENLVSETKRESPKGSQPQGILKKFGFHTKSKSSITTQNVPVASTASGRDENENDTGKTSKETQTEVRRECLGQEVRNKMSQDEDTESDTRIMKPKKIGAILSLGMGWTKPGSEKKCKSVQTEAVSLRLSKKQPAGLSSPSPVPSPTSASTPVWHSFNNSKEPLNLVVDPETKAARTQVKDDLNKFLQLALERQAGDFPRSFSSLKLPKKASSIKPASHSIEGVSSAVTGSTTEYWNYLASVSLVSHASAAVAGTGDKTLAPAIKPAGHAVALDGSSKVVVQKVKNYKKGFKQTLLGSLYGRYSAGIELSQESLSQPDSDSRSHLDLPSLAPDDMVRAGLVYETVDKFNTYARGMMRRCLSYSRMPNELRRAIFQPQRYFSQPLDFQRQRVPWHRGHSEEPCKRIDGGDGNHDNFLDGAPNPFQKQSLSIGVQCELSPTRQGVNMSTISDVSMRDVEGEDRMQVTQTKEQQEEKNNESDGSASQSSGKESAGGAAAAVSGSRQSVNVSNHDDSDSDDDVSSGTSSRCAVDVNESNEEDEQGGNCLLAGTKNLVDDIPRIDNENGGSSTIPDEGDENIHFITAVTSPKPAGAQPSESSVSTQTSEGDDPRAGSPGLRSGLSEHGDEEEADINRKASTDENQLTEQQDEWGDDELGMRNPPETECNDEEDDVNNKEEKQ